MRNAVSRSVKGVAGTVMGLALAAVDVANNSLDVLSNAASSSGPKSVSKFVDEDYFHGYGCPEHSVGSVAVTSAIVTGANSSTELAVKTVSFEVMEPGAVIAAVSAVLTSAKSRTVVPNCMSGCKTLLEMSVVMVVDSRNDATILVVASVVVTALVVMGADSDGRMGSVAGTPTRRSGPGSAKDVASLSSGCALDLASTD